MITRLGFAYYQIPTKALHIIRACRKEHISCFYVKEVEDTCIVGVYLHQQKKLKELFPSATFLYTSGILGMITRNLMKKERIISYVCVVFIWSLLSMSVFQITIYGESDALDSKIQEATSSYLYNIKDVKGMKLALMKQFKEDISWIEVYDKGSIINVRYALKKHVTTKEKQDAPLIAKKDGMIAYFKLDAGFKLKQVDDIVRKGEVIVDNKMPDSYGINKPVLVSGAVYAYTWQRVDITIDNNALPDAINYWQMLLMARDELAIESEKEEHIEKENVLHFTRKEDTISLSIVYTLLEDITS